MPTETSDETADVRVQIDPLVAIPELEPQAVQGACSNKGCRESNLIICAYIDGKGHACATQWCIKHSQKVGESIYCRRHAGIIIGLGPKAHDPKSLPPVDTRGVSLVNWIVSEGHDILHQAIAASIRPTEVIFEDRTVNVAKADDGTQSWERGWRIGDRIGITSKILICVEEKDDATVFLKVDDKVLAQGVPPWIIRRRQGQTVTPEVDSNDRRQFYGFLESFIRKALTSRG